jgi:hypothetical protein
VTVRGESVDQGLRVTELDLPVGHQVAVGVVDAHASQALHVDAGDAVEILEQGVARPRGCSGVRVLGRGLGDLDVVRRECACAQMVLHGVPLVLEPVSVTVTST